MTEWLPPHEAVMLAAICFAPGTSAKNLSRVKAKLGTQNNLVTGTHMLLRRMTQKGLITRRFNRETGIGEYFPTATGERTAKKQYMALDFTNDEYRRHQPYRILAKK